jgi:hypothetical protein
MPSVLLTSFSVKCLICDTILSVAAPCVGLHHQRSVPHGRHTSPAKEKVLQLMHRILSVVFPTVHATVILECNIYSYYYTLR